MSWRPKSSMIRMPLLAFICKRRGIDSRRFVQAQLQHAGNQFAADDDAGALAQNPARIELRRSSFSSGCVHHWIVQADHLVVDFDRVGNQHRIVIHAQHTLGEAGFSVAGGPVDEDRVLRNNGRAELIEHAVASPSGRKTPAAARAVDLHLGRLDFGGGVIFAAAKPGRRRRIAKSEIVRRRAACRRPRA